MIYSNLVTLITVNAFYDIHVIYTYCGLQMKQNQYFHAPKYIYLVPDSPTLKCKFAAFLLSFDRRCLKQIRYLLET